MLLKEVTDRIDQGQLLKFIGKKEDNFKVRGGKIKYFTCPSCYTDYGRTFIPNSGFKSNCVTCGSTLSLCDLIKVCLPSMLEADNKEVLEYLSKELNLDITTHDTINELLNFYSDLGFDLTPIAVGDKRPIEVDWVNVPHTDMNEWKLWIEKGYNIGIKTGKINNILVIDFDDENIPDIFNNKLTLIQKTNRGYQYFYKYTDKYRKTNLRNSGYNVDIMTDGGQVVAPPSITAKCKRVWNSYTDIIDLPVEIEEWLDSKIKNTKINTEDIFVPQDGEDYSLCTLGDGQGRNNLLIHLGGILKKELNLSNLRTVLKLINDKFFNPPLDNKELGTLLGSLEKYIHYDEKDLAVKVLKYLHMVDFAKSTEIVASLNESKLEIEKALKYLELQEQVIKKGRTYTPVSKVDWQTDLIDDDINVPFDVPYFHKYATFVWGDTILIGGMSGTGKTHIAMNIMKRFQRQNISCYYWSNEGGSRFKRVASQIGLIEGDFKYHPFFDPYQLSFEKNSVTIVDWILPPNYAEVDKLMGHLSQKISSKNALGIVFMQLKDDGSWYSKKMAEFFPSLTARYFYDDEKGESGFFQVDKIREAKIKAKNIKIPCCYDYHTKELVEIDVNII